MTANIDRAQRIVGGVIDRLTTDKSGVPVATGEKVRAGRKALEDAS